jgi:sugar phosphate isomerase/epimerase
VELAAINGTFNMAHPDPREREAGLRRLRRLAERAPLLSNPVITLCTGTRDAGHMWRAHPDNGTPEAWSAMLSTMEAAAAIAEECGVILAFEPEVSNVVDSPVKARRLLDTIGSPRLKVVMDAANVFHKGELPRMREVLEETFDLLGSDVAVVHAKDLQRDGEAGHAAAGTGFLDYDRYLWLLHGIQYEGPLILHSLGEAQVEQSATFLREKLLFAGHDRAA